MPVLIRLSENFSLKELTDSQTAARLGIDNTPPPEVIDDLRWGCINVLEPIRANFKSPVVISSGYRSPALNEAVGGSAKSQHMLGQAVDFTIPGFTSDEGYLAQRIAQMPGLPYDQLIFEFDSWVHISWNPRGLPKHQLLTINRHGVQPGIIV